MNTASAATEHSFRADRELRAELEKLAHPGRVSKGTILFRQGEESRGVFLMVSGKAVLLLPAGRIHTGAREMAPGSMLGLPATLSGKPYSLTAEVVEDSLVALIPKREFQNLMRRRPDLCMRIVTLLSRELTEMPYEEAPVRRAKRGR